MKKFHILSSVTAVIIAFTLFSCQTVKEIVGTPTLSLESVGIQSLDLEGITFNCNYSITNPYPVAFSIKEVAANILCNGNSFSKIVTSKGINVTAMGSKTNALSFKIPYDSILNLAKSISGKTALPFAIDGSASLDLSSIPLLENKTLSLPFNKSFDVPVFKPSLSLSDIKIKLPSFETIRNAFLNSGMNAVQAVGLATALIQGKNISEDDLKKLDLNLDLLMNLNVKNSGSAAWNFLVNNCSLNTTVGSLIDIKPTITSAISSGSGTVPLKASINTAAAAAFISQILNKTGSNPVFSLSSKLSFTDLKYAPNIPLSYSYEIPVSKVGISQN
ncbi:MAG: LEA type 2 family protein [Treponema sp.]|nr:LEA type 2 family protein [Treponema sp.]